LSEMSDGPSRPLEWVVIFGGQFRVPDTDGDEVEQ
jgi:hypothetical protein